MIRFSLKQLLILLIVIIPNIIMAQPDSTFETVRCWDSVPNNLEGECGWITVTEDRSTNTGKLQIAVVRFKGTQPDNTPIFLLAGGPGQAGITIYGSRFTTFIEPLLQERDVVIFDQRGTGLSNGLSCELPNSPEYDYSISYDGYQYALGYAQYIYDCGIRFAEEGIPIHAYSTAESATDLIVIAQALGYDQFDLYGTSYGTSYALAVMRDYPEQVRSVVLDAPIPSHIPRFELGLQSFVGAMRSVFTRCAQEPLCTRNYPDLEQVYVNSVQTLTSFPVTIHPIDESSGVVFDVSVNGNVFAGLIYNAMYHPIYTRLIPSAIYGSAYGDYSRLEELASAFLAPSQNIGTGISDGMMFAVICGEDAPFESFERIQEQQSLYPTLAYPAFTAIQAGEQIIPGCESWEVGELDPKIRRAITSDIPTLILVGEHDQITPPWFAQEVGGTLSNAQVFTLTGFGHSVFGQSLCAQELTTSFLRDPWQPVDDSCVQDLEPIQFLIGTNEG